MVHMVKWVAFSTCVCFAVDLSHGVPLQGRPSRSCEEVCARCNDDEIATKTACNCPTTQKLLLQESPCHGKLLQNGITTEEKPTIRRKRCTAEELYQLRERMEATRRNIEWLREKKTLPGVNLHPVYYPRQAQSIRSAAIPEFVSLDSARDLLRSQGGNMEIARNSHPWQRATDIREQPSRHWRHSAGEAHDQDTQDFNDSGAPRRHYERAPLPSQETTTIDPVEFLQRRRRLLEENLQMLLKNVESSENVQSKSKSISIVDSTEDKKENEIENTVLIAQFNEEDSTADSVTNNFKNLSKKSHGFSATFHGSHSNLRANVTRPLLVKLDNKTEIVGSLPASKSFNILEFTTETAQTATEQQNRTRNLLDVIVDIAVLPPSQRNAEDKWIGEHVNSLTENEEERRNESFISEHRPQTLPPPIVLNSNPGFRMSRNNEDGTDEDGVVSTDKNFVPSVSKVFILKSFKSENANFGVPKANDLFLHKKRITTRIK